MRVLRVIAGALLWIGASLLAAVAVLLCATIVLLPLGIPLLRLAGRGLVSASRLVLPAALAHPVKHAKGKVAGAVLG